MSKIIEVKELFFGYDESPVLNGINFNIEKGMFVSIIGPNGSGKTTLLKIISSVFSPLSGSVLLKGKDIRKYRKRDIAKIMAFVPQQLNMEFEFTVLDIVLMGRSPYLTPFQTESKKDMDIAMDAMSMTNTLHLKDKRITEISGGERQRAIIACALAQTPEVLLLDEPISNLDIQHQLDVMGILKKLNKQNNMTVVTVLHDLNMAAEYSDAVMLLKDGKLLQWGHPSKVITKENIKNAYNASVYMMENPLSGTPHIIPIPQV